MLRSLRELDCFLRLACCQPLNNLLSWEKRSAPGTPRSAVSYSFPRDVCSVICAGGGVSGRFRVVVVSWEFGLEKRHLKG